jgi:hypothetical protein
MPEWLLLCAGMNLALGGAGLSSPSMPRVGGRRSIRRAAGRLVASGWQAHRGRRFPGDRQRRESAEPEEREPLDRLGSYLELGEAAHQRAEGDLRLQPR